MKNNKRLFCDVLGFAAFALIALGGAWNVWCYLSLGSLEATVTMLIIQVLFALLAFAAWRGRLPWLLLPVAVFGFVLAFTTNYAETTAFNWVFWLQTAAAAIGAVWGTLLLLVKKLRHRCIPRSALLLFALVCLGALCVWRGWSAHDRALTGLARHAVWEVPARFDSVESARPGTVEELFYDTKAYGTDGRDVQKSALVYLPYGYDETQRYNILYLMHGTGDDQYYWLRTHVYNKTMLDNLIANGDIEPLIVVTPTFYVEDDFKDTGLDPLTYSFREELRNDLMPAAESKYATYAESIDDAGFAASREHRAFAGLSRGAVTTFHSAFCGSLDYFAWFGTFSGSRTDADYFRAHIQSEGFRDLPIRYLYVSSGVFDFALPRQEQDVSALLALEPRLVTGVNTDFDVFPMRYHSMGDWHLALYNLLQRIF